MSKSVENTIPVLPVSDIQRSLEFYTTTLGWKLEWSTANLGAVSMDGSQIMLSQMIPVGIGTGSWAWVGLTDDSLFQTYRDCGVKIVQEPKNWAWAYEMKIADPDGNVLWLGTSSRSDLPIED